VQITWQPQDPPRCTYKMLTQMNRLIEQRTAEIGCRPRAGIIHLTPDLRSIDHIDFETQAECGL
jgi:hypothetical protein